MNLTSLRYLSFVTLGAIAAFLPRVICLLDIGLLLHWFVAFPIATLILLFVGMRRWDAGDRWSMLWSAVVYGVLSWMLFLDSTYFREAERWLYQAKTCKAEVLSLPANSDGSFKHIVWERSGFAGVANNVVYIVYDPDESLVAATKNNVNGKANGLPCAVFRVQRLEKYWYAVEFFTDTGWEYCT